MKRLCRILSLLGILSALPIFAQAPAGWVTLTASNIQSTTGNVGKLGTGTLCLQPVDGFNHPVAATAGGAGGIILSTPSCTAVSNGAIAPMIVPDSYLSSPQNLMLRLTIANSQGVSQIPAVGFNALQPSSNNGIGTPAHVWCSPSGGSTTCNLDNYQPIIPTQALQTTGPAGPAGPPGTGIAVNWRGPWTASTSYAVNDAYRVLNSGALKAFRVSTAYTSGSSFGSGDTSNSVQYDGLPIAGTDTNLLSADNSLSVAGYIPCADANGGITASGCQLSYISGGSPGIQTGQEIGADGLDYTTGALIEEKANNTASGTTLLELVCLNSSQQAQTCPAGSAVWYGIAVGGATGSSSGNTQVARGGAVGCAMDSLSGLAVGDYVTVSSTTAGECHDAGSSFPAAGAVVGYLFATPIGLSHNGQVELFSAGITGPITHGAVPSTSSVSVAAPGAAAAGTGYANNFFTPNAPISLASFGGVCDAQLLAGNWTTSTTITVTGLQPFPAGSPVMIPNGVSAGNPLITTGTYVSSTSLTVATAPSVSGSAGAPVYIVVGTDNTTAISNALTAFNSGSGAISSYGGSLVFPPGKCLVTGQLRFPNNGVGIGPLAVPRQANVRWTGMAADPRDGIHQASSNMPALPGTMIVDVYPGGSTSEPGGVAVAKIETYGAGTFTLNNLVLDDPAQDSLPFFLTTGTTIEFSDSAFIGSTSGTSANQDAILEGGPNYGSGTLDDPTGSFQGYCAHISNVYFNDIRRALYGQSRVDCNFFSHNYIDSGAGTNLANGAAVEMNAPSASQNSNGSYMSNRCELTNYPYCFKFTNSNGNYIAFTDTEDNLNSTGIAEVDYEGTSHNNYHVCSNQPGGGAHCQTDNNTNGSNTPSNTLVTTINSDPSIFSSPVSGPGFTATNAAGYGTGAAGFNTTPGVVATGGVNKPAGYFSSVTAESYSGSASQNDTCGWQQSYSSNSANNPTMITEYVCTLGTSGGSKLELPLATYFGTSLPTEIDASGDVIVGSSANIQIAGSGVFLTGTTAEVQTLQSRSAAQLVIQDTDASGNGATAAIIEKSSNALGSTDVVRATNNASTVLEQVYGNGLHTNIGLESIGTKFTTSGCSVSSTTGGGTAGKFTLGTNSCSVTITLNGATGITASNGWSCWANDETTAGITLHFTAPTTTTAVLAVPSGAGATDVIDFGCMAF